MRATFYELLKYAKTGIASPEMTHYDKLKALAMCKGGFPVSTITGIPPISFKSDGTPLTAWNISGNMVQSSVPSPNNPVQPEECGERTGNLLQNEETQIIVENNGIKFTRNPDGSITADGTATARAKYVYYGMAAWRYNYDTNYYLSGCPSGGSTSTYSILIDSTAVQFRDIGAGKSVNLPSGTGGTYNFEIRIENGVTVNNLVFKPMLNLGSSPLPYEPYGYKIPISCGGTTQTVYLPEPLRSMTRAEPDILQSTGTVTRYAAKAVLTGTEDSSVLKMQSSGLFYYKIAPALTEGLGWAVSTHYKTMQTENANMENHAVKQAKTSSFGSTSGVIVIKHTEYTTLNDFKTYLAAQYAAGTPVCVWYVLATAQTETVTVPTITPAKGANTLTIGTTLQPSEVSITGKIKSS